MEDLNLPNLLIVGAAKSGTTSLHNYLRQHPEIFMTKHKEPHFLINSDIGKNRIHNAVLTLGEYKSMFKTSRCYKYKGESSVMYLTYPDFSIKNINKYLSNDVKIIIILRNPIERAFAGYLHNFRYNSDENLSFEQAIEQSEKRYHEILDITPDTRYLYVGENYRKVKTFIDEFKENVHVIFYDDYVDNIDLCLAEIFDFLGIKKVPIDTTKRYMEGGWMFKSTFLRDIIIPSNKVKSLFKGILPIRMIRQGLRKLVMYMCTVNTPNLTVKMREKLKSYYNQDILQLSRLLNKDLSHWINKK